VLHSSESIDRVKIESIGGEPLRPGTSVRVSATIWASSSNDRVDVFYAADAANPVWVLVTTLLPKVMNGGSTVSVTYTLPAGAVQAVRTSLRRKGNPTACDTGPFNDHDDLVFATQ
jgi:leucyl aminopeptidase